MALAIRFINTNGESAFVSAGGFRAVGIGGSGRLLTFTPSNTYTVPTVGYSVTNNTAEALTSANLLGFLRAEYGFFNSVGQFKVLYNSDVP